MIARRKPKDALDHYRRAQALLEEVDEQESRTEHNRAWFDVRVQLAHLHLRAAEVGAAQEFRALRRARLTEMTRESSTVSDSISAASLNQPVAAFGQSVGGVTPGQVVGIVQETIQAEKRRGTIR